MAHPDRQMFIQGNFLEYLLKIFLITGSRCWLEKEFTCSNHNSLKSRQSNLSSIKVNYITGQTSNPPQGGITCRAINEPRKSSKIIDKHVIITLHDKNVVIMRFCDKNEDFILSLQLFSSLDSYSILSIVILIYQQPF